MKISGNTTVTKRVDSLPASRSSNAKIMCKLGNSGGCSTSMASGVSNGAMLLRKCSSSAAYCVSVSSLMGRGLMPACCISGISSRFISMYWSATMPDALRRISSNCSVGAKPVRSAAYLPLWRSSIKPPTRTWKNSSKLLALIDKNFILSKSGSSRRYDWSSTRWLNSSHDISRFMYIASLVRPSSYHIPLSHFKPKSCSIPINHHLSTLSTERRKPRDFTDVLAESPGWA